MEGIKGVYMKVKSALLIATMTMGALFLAGCMTGRSADSTTASGTAASIDRKWHYTPPVTADWELLGTPAAEDRIWNYTSFDLEPDEQFRTLKEGDAKGRGFERTLTGTVPDGMKGWLEPGFDVSTWQKGLAPIGKGVWNNNEQEEKQIRSPWGDGNMLLMRTSFELKRTDFVKYRVLVKSTGSFLVYLNGRLIANYPWYKNHTSARPFGLSDEQAQHLKQGTNVLAFYGNIGKGLKEDVSNVVDLWLEGITQDPMAGVDEFEKWREETKEERCQWWKQDRFGMFIHWGVYSVPAGTYNGKKIGGIGEWIMRNGRIPVDEYRAFAKDFNPVNYDPDAWVRMAKDAGMKYIIITAKHHDGFAMFDSKADDWDVVDATPYGKDLLKPLAEACRKHGIRLGFYYSQSQDWFHPGGGSWRQVRWDPKQKGDTDKYIDEIAVPQVKELLGGTYGDVSVFWWDTPVIGGRARIAKLYRLLKFQPRVITNNRLGAGFDGDYGTPEQEIPEKDEGRNWETCMTMNGTWGYKSDDNDWKSTEKLIHNLVDIVSKNGNYLLNIGPKADGTFPEASIERLKAIGAWMKVNGESIYGCGAAPLSETPSWGRVTAGDGNLYLHVFKAPESGTISLTGVKGKPIQAWLLADPQRTPLKLTVEGEKLVIQLPATLPDPIDTVVALELMNSRR